MKKPFLHLFAALSISLVSLVPDTTTAQTQTEESPAYRVHQVAEGLEHPWALAFLPDRRMLVTERPGRLRMIDEKGNVSAPLKGVPEVFAEGQGGLLDVLVDPNFDSNQTLYLCYAEEQDGKAGTALASARWQETKGSIPSLQQVQVIFRQLPKVKGDNHWGCRLAVDKKRYLFITLGDRFNYSEQAQTLDNHMGKVIRIHTDGTVPEDNPFVNDKKALPEIWSYGHRNSQGAAIHPETGSLWMHEHGPRGGDEINITEPGKNYGWPEASYGSHYSFIPIPDEHKEKGFTEPAYYWTPSIAPSGMLFYSGKAFPEWKGNLFVGALAGMKLVRLELEGNKPVKEENLLQEKEERIRDVREGPEGFIYVLTDSEEGRILRLEPR
jgi:glucose/arabinose dehydrogenase